MNKKGFTIVELLASFTLTMIIMVFLFEVVLELKEIYLSTNYKTISLDRNALVSTELNEYFSKYCNGYRICRTKEGNKDYIRIINENGYENTIGIESKKVIFPKEVEITNFTVENGQFTNNINYLGDNRYIRVKYKLHSVYFKKDLVYNYVYTYRDYR